MGHRFDGQDAVRLDRDGRQQCAAERLRHHLPEPRKARRRARCCPRPAIATRGTVTFIERSDGVQVSYNLAGMPPNSEHALQVHERGDCIVVNESRRRPGVRAGRRSAEGRRRASKAISAIFTRTRTARRRASSSRRTSRSTACARSSRARSCCIATPSDPYAMRAAQRGSRARVRRDPAVARRDASAARAPSARRHVIRVKYALSFGRRRERFRPCPIQARPALRPFHRKAAVASPTPFTV